MARPDKYHVQVLDRTLRILVLLGESERDLGPSELAARLSLPRSTTHRLLQVLEQRQFIRKSATAGKYGLGIRLLEIGRRVVARVDLAARALPFLRQLVDVTGETAHICVFNDGQMVSIANVEGPLTLQRPWTVGRRTPMHCTSVGKSFLAFLQPARSAALIDTLTLQRRTKNTIVTRSALRAELHRIRRRGYATDNEEAHDGLWCVGAPILNHNGYPVAAISIAAPAIRVTRQALPQIAHAVLGAAAALSHVVGHL